MSNILYVLEQQLTDILKRWISNVASFEKVRGKVREYNYGKKVQGKNTGKKVRERESTGKKVRPDGLFRSREFVSSGEKGSTRSDIAQLPVAHAQNTLPNRPLSVTSLPVTSGQACANVA